MQFVKEFKDTLFETNQANFEQKALALFRFQAVANPLYASYLRHLRCSPEQVSHLAEIPFLPIEFFKSHSIQSTQQPAQMVFESSGTTGQVPSRHLVADTALYQAVSRRIFEQHYGALSGYHFLALLPAYLERQHSSLVYMINHFIEQAASPFSGYYLYDYPALIRQVENLQKHNSEKRKIMLWGVTFALLDLAEAYRLDWQDVEVVETGGMKGRRQELTRAELHGLLKERLGVERVGAEYGMTELLSQAYASAEGVFEEPFSMRIYLRELNDPFSLHREPERSGAINIIDLANVDSCAFIESKDIGRLLPDGRFEVLGRMDNSDIRGCSLLAV